VAQDLLSGAKTAPAEQLREYGVEKTRPTWIRRAPVAEKSIAELAEKMKDIDFAVLSTRTEGGAIAGAADEQQSRGGV
jgi:hypothetical protein